MKNINDGQVSDERPCPVCNSVDYTLFAPERIDQNKISSFTYASRKDPEFMCLKLVTCSECELVYAPRPPENKFLADAYTEASYDSDVEAKCAARTYAYYLEDCFAKIQNKKAAIDVGAGNGALLPYFTNAGFNRSIGIEPSMAAIAAAPPEIRPNLRIGMFSNDLVKDLDTSFICSFMTLEHLSDPMEFARNAFDLLNSGGAFAVVVHNREGLLNRLLGLRSPIIDVEHLQLFNPKSAAFLFKRAGFSSVSVRPIINSYPISYWTRLSPFSEKIKKNILNLIKNSKINKTNFPLPVGNMIITGFKK